MDVKKCEKDESSIQERIIKERLKDSYEERRKTSPHMVGTFRLI